MVLMDPCKFGRYYYIRSRETFVRTSENILYFSSDVIQALVDWMYFLLTKYPPTANKHRLSFKTWEKPLNGVLDDFSSYERGNQKMDTLLQTVRMEWREDDIL